MLSLTGSDAGKDHGGPVLPITVGSLHKRNKSPASNDSCYFFLYGYNIPDRSKQQAKKESLTVGFYLRLSFCVIGSETAVVFDWKPFHLAVDCVHKTDWIGSADKYNWVFLVL
ncbi:hypothetical protein CDAR_397031 [Caerostris darwini]|uniref:Uncharacterized protein n=1 Tax=Caerostris darwini TaxID=1538125 RepID=A0AAV4Q8R7_9ARAC|nr:hypothetical protein CDAR_397031 [Caerostris darwini]